MISVFHRKQPLRTAFNQNLKKPKIDINLEKNIIFLPDKPLNNIIEFSNTTKITHQTKNFIVNYNGFPLRNKEFNILIKQGNETQKPLIIPLFKTDDNGIMYILTKPQFYDNGIINKEKSLYQKLKFSNRLGFVFKNNNSKKNGNIFYMTNYVARYIDIGIGVHFLRTMIQKSSQGKLPLDCSKNSVIHNWINAVMNTKDTRKEYKKFNSHTERTAKALKYTNYTSNILAAMGAVGVTAGAVIATMGLVTPIIIGIGGGVLATGSTTGMISKQMHNETADISRLQDTKKTAEKTINYIK